MKYKLRWAIIFIVIVGALISLFPLNEKIKLGLDLRGGMYVLLGVDVDKAVEAKLDTLVTQIKKDLRGEKVGFNFVRKENGKIIVALKDNSLDKVKEIINKHYPILKESGLGNADNVIEFTLDPKEVERIKDYAVEQAAQVIRNRVDQFGVAEPIIQRQGKTNILVQLPGINDPDRAIKLIGKTAQLKFHLVDDTVTISDIQSGNVPFDDIILYQKVIDKRTGKIVQNTPFALKRDAVLTGDYLVDAEVRISSQFNEPYVWIKFDSAGSRLFEEITRNNVGKRLAIVLDNNVYSAPVIREAIAGGEAQITGNFTMEEAKDLAIVLRAGSLPAPVKILENRTVGPSLGKDSIQKGITASIIGFVLVVLFMAVYYRFAGVIADIALFLNFIIILGVMGMFKATLTLPGIAGLILTIGMSVDANVLIFERIREEVRLGRTALSAIEAGFEKAMSTILDANITTLIAAIVLFQFGTGPVKGFAVTLSIGILASMFTAIFVSKTIFLQLYESKENRKLSI
ncbi:protein translocase subunit SecD [Deferribacter autotrophicus]|uniref:Protein translocase subunit SecD n=1 Tax=Deferribacter autotrophicus TaxID=500465 RepID=A0A5A8F713_9BACT|nr:protein translocase subunit SecD [Deferribacter autotrophicus]KAA0258679.1 protein translocase subunit SecD [Deferribacter autotrophicus]